jgi:hypothetical protein
MRYAILFLLATAFLFASCESDPEEVQGKVNLNFQATYQDAPLVMFDEVYTYPDGSPVKIKLFNYYVSDITLMADGAGEDQLISEVELIDYAEVYDVNTAAEGLTINLDNIKPGVYTGVRIGLGLTGQLNATQPGEYEAGHPLSDNFWSWARGYVFAKIEANADIDGDGQFSDKLTYHIGSDDLFTTLEMPKSIVVKAGEPAQLNFTVDLYDVLNNNGNYLDISEASNTQDHTNNEAIYGFLWENLSSAFKVNN